MKGISMLEYRANHNNINDRIHNVKKTEGIIG